MSGPVFRISEKTRQALKKPYGSLYEGDGPEVVDLFRDELMRAPFVVTVGDVTTSNLIEAGFFPHLCLVDRLTKRMPVPREISEKTLHVIYSDVFIKNPAGGISGELIRAVADGLSAAGARIRINVEGEEDLATIPVIAFCRVGTVVLYGQPDEGVVLVKVTAAKKEEMTALLKEIVGDFRDMPAPLPEMAARLLK